MNFGCALLCALRVACCLLPGYIHPDEWFQSPEVTASAIFGIKGYIPWEYSPEFPCRSPTVAMLGTGVPFLAVRLFTARPSPTALFLAPRVYMCALSFVLDACVYVLHRMAPGEVALGPALTLLGLSWPVLVFGVRPFSNTIELLILAVTTTLCFRFYQKKTHTIALLIGAIVGLGIFNRITFVAFAVPLGVLFFWAMLKEKNWVKCTVGFSFTALTGFLLAAGVLVACDSVYFGHFVVTPLNFLQYNSDTSNLALHGLHPRWLHSLVNAPMLLGPLYAAVIACAFVRPTQSPLVTACLGIIATSIALLSAAPHQELRFLLPLVFPAVIATQWTVRKKTFLVLLVSLLAIFSSTLICLFGAAHQGGVIPALMYVGEHSNDIISTHNTTFVFCKTYMPPRHLLGVQPENMSCDVVDLGGSCNVKTMLEKVSTVHKDTWIAVPATLKDENMMLTERGFVKMKRFWPHLSTEYPPHNIGDMSLNLYKKEVN